jgi:catechol 2,3-dioxygenase-like lactoylglutathione lyase family enzyme
MAKREQQRPRDVEVTGIDHIYLAVTDFAASVAWYDRVMRFLGFKKGTLPIGGDPHAHYYNRELQITIRPARTRARHDPYAPGMHHVCLRVPDGETVDAVAVGLRKLGVKAKEPRVHVEYADDYYATFFEDPDGIRFEIVALRRMRRLIREHWHELTEFEDPLRKAGLVG